MKSKVQSLKSKTRTNTGFNYWSWTLDFGLHLIIVPVRPQRVFWMKSERKKVVGLLSS